MIGRLAAAHALVSIGAGAVLHEGITQWYIPDCPGRIRFLVKARTKEQPMSFLLMQTPRQAGHMLHPTTLVVKRPHTWSIDDSP